MAMYVGDELVTCDAEGQITSTETCMLGCNAAASRCNKLDPSNGLAELLDETATAADLDLVGDAVIDTDAGTITDMTGVKTPVTATLSSGLPVPIFAVIVKSFTAENVKVTGTRALAIVSAGMVTLKGNLSVSAIGGTNGPGALTTDTTCHGGDAGPGNDQGQAGGGGGGFGTVGGRGGADGNPTVQGGAAGGVSGSIELVPLRGGCPGGRASEKRMKNAAGGGGGRSKSSVKRLS